MSAPPATARRSEPRVRISWQKLAYFVTATIVVFLVLAPISVLLFGSFRDTVEKLPFEATSFTLDNYYEVFASTQTYSLLLNTLWYAVGSVAVGLGLALAFAWILERTDTPCRSLLTTLIVAPMAIPPVVQGIAWVMLANPTNGYVNVLLRGLISSDEGPLNIHTMVGMVFVTAITFLPSIYLMVSSIMAHLDPVLEEASTLSGASGPTTFRRIAVPLALPALLGATIYYFVLSVELFEIPGLLGMPKREFVLSTAIFSTMHPNVGLPNYGLASGYGMVAFVLSIALIYFYGRVIGRKDQYAVVTGRGYRPRRISLGRWRYVALGTILAYVVITLLLPLFILLWTSFFRFYQTPSFDLLAKMSLVNYSNVLQSRGIMLPITNTIIIAIVAPALAMVIAALVSWFSVRSNFRGSAALSRLTFLLLGVPSVVLALALVFVYGSLPLPIYGTIWIIIIAYVTRFLTFCNQAMGPAYLQIHRELEEASSTSGAAWLQTMRRIILPLVRPTFVRAWLWVFCLSIRETTLALTLTSQDNETLVVRLWATWLYFSDVGFIAAMAVILLLLIAPVTLLVILATSISSEEKVTRSTYG